MEHELVLYEERDNDFLAPVVRAQKAFAAYQAKKEFIDRVLAKGVDFGEIPGTAKPTLLKPGAEKMVNLFGLTPFFEDVETVEDWTGANHGGEPFFYYRQRCKLATRDGRFAGAADGSCNSWEKKYRYRWVQESDVPAGMDKSKLVTRGGKISEFAFAIEKAETSGQYGKPAEYWKRFTDAIASGTAAKTTRKTKTGKQMDAWEIDSTMYQVPNVDMPEQVNTVLKMAQKRALIAAVLIVTGVSEYFTQDIEDYIDGSFVEFTQAPSAAPVVTEPVGKPANGNSKPAAQQAPEEDDPFAGLEEEMPAAPEPAPAPAPEMSLETAENVTNSDNPPVRYGDLDTDKLAKMTIGIGKALRKTDLTPEQREEYKFKLAAIGAILKHRNGG